MQPEYFTNHLGFIVDYVAEIFRELRKRNYTDAYEHHFRLGNHVEERDRKAIVKTVSGLLKLLHPDGQCAKPELEQYLSFAIEMRRRVKEQLKRMGGMSTPRSTSHTSTWGVARRHSRPAPSWA
jgi:ATP-dependent Lon protease